MAMSASPKQDSQATARALPQAARIQHLDCINMSSDLGAEAGTGAGAGANAERQSMKEGSEAGLGTGAGPEATTEQEPCHAWIEG
jgi:hypothetical protein